MATLETIFRRSPAFRPSVPAAIGLALVFLSVLIQGYVSYVRWLELTRRANWSTELAVDFRREGSSRTKFRPIVSRDHGVRFSLRTPLEGDLADYNGKDVFLPPAAAQRSLAGKEFTLSWQIVSQANVVAKGIIHCSDLSAWAMRDHAYYQYAFALPGLAAGREYMLAARVEQASLAVNELSPVLQVHAYGTLKGRTLAGSWRLWHTFLFCGVGTVLLLVAHARYVYDRKLNRPEDSLPGPVERG